MPGLRLHKRREVADEALVRSLFSEHGAAMLAYATQLTRDRAAAEDVVQEALVRAWRHPDSLVNGKGSVRGWLLTVVRNIVTDQVRARNARAPEVRESPVEVAAEGDHAEQVVNSVVVVDALSRLSAEHREVLEQVYLLGSTVAEAARTLGIPPGTVKSRSFYALRALRELRSLSAAATERCLMNSNHVDLAGYLTKSLDAEQVREVEEHLAGCAECRAEAESLREWTMALKAVPEAMLLDGPPAGGDLLLQRTLRQIRAESGGQRRRRTALVSAAAAVVVAAAIGSGVLLGRDTADPGTPVALPAPSQVEQTTIPGTRTATAVDAGTGARITVAVAPAPGWVRVKAAVAGIPAGERCRLEVVARNGTVILAGSWVVSAQGAAEGTTLDGSALVAPADVLAVRVVTEAGKQYTSVTV